jgi:hypothetical protein
MNMADKNSGLKLVNCPVCGVNIEISDGNSDKVLFSHGRPGDRKRLYARVCQYISNDKKAKCINQSITINECRNSDFYDTYFD